MFKYRYAYLSMFQVDSRWTPENHLESSGVHLNSVGECKVLDTLEKLKPSMPSRNTTGGLECEHSSRTMLKDVEFANNSR